MRILHIIYDDIGNPWLGGGGATRTLEIYSRIAAAGHHVQVLCGQYPGAGRTHSKRGVDYRYLGSARSYVISRISFALLCPFLIKRSACDIVIEDVSPFSPVGVPLWKREVPSVASVQNLSGKHAVGKYGKAGWGPRLVERPLLSLFQNFIAVSPGIAAELKASLGHRVRVKVIPNSAGDLFAQMPVASAQSPGERYILFLGRIDVYQKGLDYLVQAFDRVASQLKDIKLVIAGGGPARQIGQLANLVEASENRRRIEMTGQVDREKARQLMQGALALVMPSRYEAWPLSAIEAGAAGLSVVGFDTVGVRDAAPAFPRAHGHLVQAGDVTALAGALVGMAGDEKLRRATAERGREWAARFTWDALAERQLAFYKELVQEKQRRAR